MKSLKHFFILAILTLSVTFAFAQDGVKTYILHFPEYEMEDIKPLVFLTQPLFEDAQIEIHDDNYKQFVYKSKMEVTEADINEALEGTKFKLISLEVKD